MTTPNNHTGKKYGHLTMIAYVKSGGSGRGAIWLARCDCGEHKQVLARDATRGKVKSCGKCQYSRRQPALPRGLKTRGEQRSYCLQVLAASKENKQWYISSEKYREMTLLPCSICGTPEKTVGRVLVTLSPVHNYTPETTATLCRPCNRMRCGRPLSDFLNTLIDIHDRGFLKDYREERGR